MVSRLFSAGPESKYAVEELDKANSILYKQTLTLKNSDDLVGPENKPLRVKHYPKH